MVTFINGGITLSGETTENILVKIQNALTGENWILFSITSTSFNASPVSNLAIIFTFSIQTTGQVNYDYSLVGPNTGELFLQEVSRESYFNQANWLNIRANDGLSNFSREIYNLLFLETSKFWMAVDEERFSLTIGEPNLPFLWDCVYGGYLQERVDSSDNNDWGIGFADCRSRSHEIYRAKHDNSLWSVIGSRFYTISSVSATNLTLLNRLDDFNSLSTYCPPIHGLLDYFTTFSCTVDGFVESGSISTISNAENLWANSFYGRPNEGFYDCSVLMPAFYLEGRANASSYGSASATSVSPQLYYRGNLPYIFSGGLSLPSGFILVDEKTDFSYISTGNYLKLIMRIR
jgi:hypothetical protein